MVIKSNFRDAEMWDEFVQVKELAEFDTPYGVVLGFLDVLVDDVQNTKKFKSNLCKYKANDRHDPHQRRLVVKLTRGSNAVVYVFICYFGNKHISIVLEEIHKKDDKLESKQGLLV